MKHVVYFLLAFVPHSLFGQDFLCTLKAEQTVSGSLMETAVGLEFPSAIGTGLFIQAGRPLPGSEERFRDLYYGVYIQKSVFQSKGIAVLADLRAGLVNKNFIAVIPQLHTRVRIFRNSAVSFGTGIRHGYPSASFSLIQFLPLNKHQ